MAQTKPDGNIDAANDRKEGRDVARLHFFDTFRYVCWWWKGGIEGVTPEEFDEMMGNLMRDSKTNPTLFSSGGVSFTEFRAI